MLNEGHLSICCVFSIHMLRCINFVAKIATSVHVVDWADNARDILNFLTRYLPPKSRDAGSLPIHLPCLPYEETQDRIQSGFNDRTLITIGHSFGGCSSYVPYSTHDRLA